MNCYPDEILELREEFRAIYLNRANKINGVCLHSIGATAGTIVDIKSIIATAILSNSMAIILSHNHPSGSIKPSDADKKLTKKLISAAKLFDIQILDHLIISRENYFSFSDEGLV